MVAACARGFVSATRKPLPNRSRSVFTFEAPSMRTVYGLDSIIHAELSNAHDAKRPS
jgi:hypothetical protein